MRRIILLGILASGCNQDAGQSTGLSISNGQNDKVGVYVNFGADSKITASDWSFCVGEDLNCNFSLKGYKTKTMPNPNGEYLNATFSFGKPVGCGVTKAEVNLNNPKWYDTFDISLVDGYSNDIQMVYTPLTGQSQTLGPPKGKDGNEKVYGLFPYGCDICVARQNPPCGIRTGKDGCKKGTQYDPDVPCQVQGKVMGGGGNVEIKLVR